MYHVTAPGGQEYNCKTVEILLTFSARFVSLTQFEDQTKCTKCFFVKIFLQRPSLVFDVPGMTTDFYLNLLDWGKENILAMALGSSVYLRKEEGTSAQQLLQRTGGTACPTSVAWSCDGKRLAVGFADSQIEVWDIHAMHRV